MDRLEMLAMRRETGSIGVRAMVVGLEWLLVFDVWSRSRIISGLEKEREGRSVSRIYRAEQQLISPPSLVAL